MKMQDNYFNSFIILTTCFCLFTVCGFSFPGSERIFAKEVYSTGDICEVSIGSDLVICAGESIILTATHSAGVLLWSTGEQTDEIIIMPSITTTYSVQLTDIGCQASASITVTVVPKPVIELPYEQVICPGESVLLAPVTIDPNVFYLWSPGGFNTPAIVVSPLQTTFYALEAVNFFGCNDTAFTKVTVFGPGWIAFSHPNQTICPGDIALIIQGVYDILLYPDISYHWSPQGLTPDSLYNMAVAPTETTVYTFTATIPGCSVSDSTTITVLPPDLHGNLTGQFSFNGLTNLPMQQLVSDGSNTTQNGVGYDISFNEINSCHFNGSSSRIDLGTDNRGVSNAVTLVAWIKTTETQYGQWVAGKYSFIGDHGYSLQIGDSADDNIGTVAFGGRDGTGVYHSTGFVTNSPKVNDGQWHCLVGTAGNDNWSVYVDGWKTNMVTGSTAGEILLNSDIQPLTIGWHTNPDLPLWFNGDMDEVRIYNRVLTDCEIDSVCANRNLTGIIESIVQMGFGIYPNPNSGTFTIHLNEPASADMVLRITDFTGRLLIEQSVTPANTEQWIQTGDLPNGLYFLQMVLDGNVAGVERFVKQ